MKSFLLSSVRPFYAPDDEKGVEKTDAEKQRESIKVTNGDEKKEEDKDDTKDKVDEKVEDKKEEKDEDESEEDDEKEEDEAKELTAEQKEINKLNKTIERLQKRVGKTTGEKAAVAQQLSDAQKALTEKVKDGEGLSEEEVERRAEIKANEKTTQREFDKAVAKLTKDATKIDKDFMTKVNEMASEVAPIPSAMIGILEDLDNGGAVLAYLAENVEDYEEIFSLPVAKMASRLNKISDKIIEETKEKPKKISKVPEPPEKLKGNANSPGILNDKMPMDDWVRLRQQQAEERRKARQR